MYVQGACGGTSPSWLTHPLETHLQRMGDAFEESIRSVWNEMKAHTVPKVVSKEIPLCVKMSSSQVTPDGLPGRRVLELCMLPLRRLLDQIAREGIVDNQQVSLTVVQFGSVVLLGVPGELGPVASLKVRAVFADSPVDQLMIASLCNGYIGYVHRRSDYRFKRGMRFLALYENAMSMAGRNAGEGVVSLLKENLAT